MAEIEITLPTVQYGNVKVRATPEELGLESIADSHALGQATAVYLNLFTQGFKLGATMDVSTPQAASQDADMVKAHEMLNEGLGVTELSDPHAPGGSHYEDPTAGYDLADRSGEAPWNKQVDTPKKPWETEGAAPKVVLDDGW